MHGVRCEKDERPSAADEGARENAVNVLTLEKNAERQDAEADDVTEADLFGVAKSGEFVREVKRDTDHEDGDPDFVEPVCTEHLLDVVSFSPRARWGSVQRAGNCLRNGRRRCGSFGRLAAWGYCVRQRSGCCDRRRSWWQNCWLRWQGSRGRHVYGRWRSRLCGSRIARLLLFRRLGVWRRGDGFRRRCLVVFCLQGCELLFERRDARGESL